MRFFCCSTAGCTYGVHAQRPLGLPIEIKVDAYTTWHITPTYIVRSDGTLTNVPVELQGFPLVWKVT